MRKKCSSSIHVFLNSTAQLQQSVNIIIQHSYKTQTLVFFPQIFVIPIIFFWTDSSFHRGQTHTQIIMPTPEKSPKNGRFGPKLYEKIVADVDELLKSGPYSSPAEETKTSSTNASAAPADAPVAVAAVPTATLSSASPPKTAPHKLISRLSEEAETLLQNCFRGDLRTPNTTDLSEDDLADALQNSWDTAGKFINKVGLSEEQIKEWLVEALEEAEDENTLKTTRFCQVLRESLMDHFAGEESCNWFVLAGYGLGFEPSMVAGSEFFLDLVVWSSGLRVVVWKGTAA